MCSLRSIKTVLHVILALVQNDLFSLDKFVFWGGKIIILRFEAQKKSLCFQSPGPLCSPSPPTPTLGSSTDKEGAISSALLENWSVA